MKGLVRHLIIVIGIFYYLGSFFPQGFRYQNDWRILFWAGLVFVLIDLLLKPVLKLIFLPVNLLTFGMFRWVVNVFVLFLATSLVSGFDISAFAFDGATLVGVSLAPHNAGTLGAFIVFSFLIALAEGIVYWLWE